MLGKKLINAGPVATGGANTFASENFETVTYTGNGGTQRIGGYINRGAVFNGSSSYITTPFNTSNIVSNINDRTQDFSISLWINPSVIPSSGSDIIFYVGNYNVYSPQYHAILLKFQNGNTIFTVYDGVEYNASTSSVTINNWYHISCVRESSVLKLYVNGSLVDSVTQSGDTSISSSATLKIGQTYSASDHYNGKLDQVRIFNKALSSSEVTTLYGETYASSTVSTTDIFSDNSGVALYQLDGNANDTGKGAIDSGQSAEFNGSSSYIDLPVLGLGGSSARSVSAWIKTTNNSTTQFIFGSGTQASYQVFAIHLSPTGKVSVSYSASQLDTTSSPINNNQWHHIVATFSGGSTANTTLYVDGVSQTLTEIGTTGTVNTGNQNYAIGYNSPNPSYPFYFNGQIDDVRVYSDVLTSTEIGYLYNNTTASIPTDNFVSYYKLDGNANDTQGSNNGTWSGSELYSLPAEFPTYNGTATNVTYQEATKFQPDLVWIKSRTTTNSNFITDSIRGAGIGIFSNLTNGNTDESAYFTSFDSNGFSLALGGGNTNGSGTNYVAWCFKGGGTAVSNTDGSITSTVSANQDAGFSIVEFTSPSSGVATIGTGLNQQAELVIAKVTNTAADWPVYVNGFNTTDYLILNTTAAKATYGSDLWNLSNWSTNLIGCHRDMFGTSNSVIAYCFHSVEGYSKIGSYTGTAASGNSVTTGFEPQFVMIKRSDSTSNWAVFDNERNTQNPRNNVLFPNDSAAEADLSTYEPDVISFNSNGFTINDDASAFTGGTNFNISGGTYIYLAIAADPDTTTPTVENSFDVVTWTGDGTYPPASDGSDDTTVYTDFKPDLIWAKDRNGTISHILFDSVRGNNRQISSNTTDAETVRTNDSYIINEDGFTVSTYGNLNNATDYVAWCWKAGDHDDNLPQINTEGSIDSVVSVNAAAGFSIVKYTGQSAARTVGHGLSSTPEMVIIKNLDDARNWMVYHKDLSASSYIFLNLTNAEETDTRTNGGQPRPFGPFTSTTFGVNIDNETGYTNDYIAYCFHSVSGYQKIGSYTGGTANQKITTGFKPRFLIVKESSGTYVENWVIYDGVRSPSDPRDDLLLANTSNSEYSNYSTHHINFETDGFTLVQTSSAANGSGGTYIYLAIA